METLLDLPEEQLRDLHLLDERFPDVRVELGMARAEFAARASIRAYADQLVAIDATLREAREFPEVFVGIDQAGLPDSVEFSERAAIADLAVRLASSEQTIRAQANEAAMLMERAPKLWWAFRDGAVSIPNARAVAELIATLPAETCAAFEDAVLDAAGRLAPARFRARARVVRERLHSEALAERHRRSAEDRRVHFEADLDGMAWLHLYLPADSARRAMARLDHVAKSLAAAPDEARTLAQLRADAAADAVAGVLGAAGSVGVQVAVTVPVMTLLGESEEPGILEGYGPIDAETARRLCAHAPSFHRILTHPVTGVVLDHDRTTYRVPADLKRRVQVRDVICTFIGCGRLASECDLDHTLAWEHDGKTADINLAALCRNHHRLKHRTRWQMTQDPVTGIYWTSPTGATRGADPPPF
jgi:hypothetical protein